MSLLKLDGLRVAFATPTGPATVVDGLSFALEAGETLCIAGESGSGKSVTALSLMGLLPKPSGRVTAGVAMFQGRDLFELSDREMQAIRGDDIAMIFQEPMTSLNPVLSIGTELFLPIEVKGALFSIGDPHAAQGDGEVCGTAIESQHKATLKLDLVKGANLKMPRFRTPGPVSRHLDEKGYDVTTGIGPDLFTGARAAVSGMIDLLTKRHNMSAIEAYMLCSVCADLRISEIVDMPNWVVSLYFPRVVLD